MDTIPGSSMSIPNDNWPKICRNDGLRYIIGAEKQAYYVGDIDLIGYDVIKRSIQYVDDDGPGHDHIHPRIDVEFWCKKAGPHPKLPLAQFYVGYDEDAKAELYDFWEDCKNPDKKYVRFCLVKHMIFNVPHKTMKVRDGETWFE